MKILVISGRVVTKNAKVDFPDMNFPDSGQTILRTIHDINYEQKWVQLDGEAGPVFHAINFPSGVSFYEKIAN